jgi:hypothetical protein
MLPDYSYVSAHVVFKVNFELLVAGYHSILYIPAFSFLHKLM